MLNKFIVEGMTCDACVKKIAEKLNAIPQVQGVNVNLKDRTAIIESFQGVSLAMVREALEELPKYKVHDDFDEITKKSAFVDQKESTLKTYKPLILIFVYIVLTALSYQFFQGAFHLHLFMNHIMAGFFIGLSYFKFLDLKSFAESFSSYDPIAQKFLKYGFIYPFIELILGLMFISKIGLLAANFVTIIILSVTTIGVIKRLQSKSKIQCACAGAGFNLPLSYVTVFENLAMIIMATAGLLPLLTRQ